MTVTVTHRLLRIAAALAAVAAGTLLATASAQAAAATSATCTSRFTVTITPGFSVKSSSGTITSSGETGSIACSGKISGQRVTGAGTVGLDEGYARGDCLSHVGTGTVRITVPTTAGPKQMVGAATSRRTALVVRAEVRFPGARFSGIGLAIPTHGTCLLTPMRRAALFVTGTLKGA